MMVADDGETERRLFLWKQKQNPLRIFKNPPQQHEFQLKETG